MRTLWRLIASFFKWTWRILNFIRKLALNAIFLVLVLVCIGIWSQFSTTTSEHAARARCCWILPAWWWINLPPAASSA
ncbi:hypothetical protein RBI80_20160 [Klebsiella variicola]|nr:hypothetical protein RBI80_20160 [Klebsiella variicola]